MIKDKRKKKTTKRKTASRKKRSTSKRRRRKNPTELGILDLKPLKGNGRDRYHLVASIGKKEVFKTEETYPHEVAVALIPTFHVAIKKAILAEDKEKKRKNPKPRKHQMVSDLLKDSTFDEAVAKTQSLPSNPEEAFHLGFVAGLSHGLRYNALIDFFEKRRVRKRIKQALDAGLGDLSSAIIRKQTLGTGQIRRQKFTK